MIAVTSHAILVDERLVERGSSPDDGDAVGRLAADVGDRVTGDASLWRGAPKGRMASKAVGLQRRMRRLKISRAHHRVREHERERNHASEGCAKHDP